MLNCFDTKAFICYFPEVAFAQLSLLIFGFFGILGTMTSLLLPETLSHWLPDDLNEAELINSKPVKQVWKWWSWKTLKTESAKNRSEILSEQKTEIIQINL